MIVVEGLSRAFNGRAAVEDLTFTVPPGALFALLGPNGAGKTTTVRLLMGLIAPSKGGATVADGRFYHLTLAEMEQIPWVVAALAGAGAAILRVEPESASLEALYLRAVRQDD